MEVCSFDHENGTLLAGGLDEDDELAVVISLGVSDARQKCKISSKSTQQIYLFNYYLTTKSCPSAGLAVEAAALQWRYT